LLLLVRLRLHAHLSPINDEDDDKPVWPSWAVDDDNEPVWSTWVVGGDNKPVSPIWRCGLWS
jgi:hypothetical protein